MKKIFTALALGAFLFTGSVVTAPNVEAGYKRLPYCPR